MFYISDLSLIYANIIRNVINVSKGMNLKNLMLTIMAFLLACCLGFLIFVAMHQQALAQVHETISSFSNIDEIAEAKSNTTQEDKHSLKAAMEKDENEEPYDAKNYKPIAKLTTHNLKENEKKQADLPQFSKALDKAQTIVNNDNDRSNKYNDYGIDSTCQGAYYFIFTFENKAKPGKYYRVTVNDNNQATIFDKAYEINDNQHANQMSISPQESEVIAQKHAVDELGENAILKKVHESKDGMFYTFHEYETQKDYKVIVNKTGDVIRQPSLNE